MSEDKETEPSWSAWLIERGEACAPEYLAINEESPEPHGVFWTRDAESALQFRRRHDASTVRVCFLGHDPQTRVAEHGFGPGPYQDAPDGDFAALWD